MESDRKRKIWNIRSFLFGKREEKILDKRLLDLARDISRAGKEIAHDDINKEYRIGYGRNMIIITSDSGYEAILIGDVGRLCKDGYMCLYTNNTEKRNSFPSVRELAKLLEAVAEGKKLPEGEGKAAYYDWPEFGGLDRQLEYFSRVVKNLADFFKI